MTTVLQAAAGAVVALVLDWAIYTHLSAFLRLGIVKTPRVAYSQLTHGRFVFTSRTAAMILAGTFGGLAFAFKNVPLWLVCCSLFLLAHAGLYALPYKRA